MPREVDTMTSFTDKLVKLIPTEIVGAYTVFTGMIEASANADIKRVGLWAVFCLLLLLTPAYLLRVSKVRNGVQLAVASLSFAVWAYALGGPFKGLPLYDPLVGSVILGMWSVITPVLVKPARRRLRRPVDDPV
jgi:hypothetical protein